MMLGIDVGYSTVDCVLMEDKVIRKRLTVPSKGKIIGNLFISNFNSFSHINHIHSNATISIPGKKVALVDGIEAIGRGALFCAKEDHALVVSCGTGTCLVHAGKTMDHVGGTPVGGGMLLGLGKMLCGTADIKEIERLANQGDHQNVDLLINDIYPEGLGLYDKDGSAAYFSRPRRHSKEDLAAALCNIIGQTIGTVASLAAKSCQENTIIATGRLMKVKIIQDIMRKRIERMSGCKLIVPKDFEYATAIGTVV
jgi:pantothenate kinase